MTRKDQFDWFKAHDCEFEPLKSSSTANAIKVTNPKNGKFIFLNTPIDDKRVKEYTVCKSCMDLGIPIPDFCNGVKEIAAEIKNRFYPHG